MNFNIDIAIVLVFLTLTLIVGLIHGQKVKTIKDYALGGRNFSTGALVATIVATYASGSGFFIILSKTYSDGFHYAFASAGIGISFFIMSLVLAPRMGEFLGKISIAEAMGDLYGKNVRVITAFAGTIGSAGLIAIQFKAFGSVISYFIGVPVSLAIIISGIIATIYSAFGGIRAVTFTDVLQGIAFGVVIPLLGFVIWNQFYYGDVSLDLALSNPKFDINMIFDSTNIGFWNFIFLLIYFSIPTILPVSFQRISMGSSIAQVKKALMISGIIFIIIKIAIAWIPFLIYSVNPNIEPNQLLPYIVDTFSFTGLKGLIIIAIIAFAMSTADSGINSASTLFTHDIYSLFIKSEKKELHVARIFACILGFSTIALSLMETDLLGIIVFANSFYSPLVLPPFLLAIFGFRSSSKSVLIGMIVALTITILWKFLPSGFLPVSQNVIGVLFALLCNTIFLIGSHYVLRQKGGWVGIKDRTYLDEQKKLKLQKRKDFSNWIKNYSIRNICKKIAPHNDLTYTSLGLYFIACTITTMYSTQVELLGSNAQLMKIIYPSMLVTGTFMSMYQIWPLSVANSIKKTIIETWYPIAIFYMLIFFSCFFVLVSKFAPLQIALFTINSMIAALLLGWRLALPSILFGFYTAIQFYQYFFGGSEFIVRFGSPEFILIYTVLFLGSAVIFFLKPKQQHLEETEAKVTTLETDVTHLNHELTDAADKVCNLTGEVTNLNKKVAHYNQRVVDQEKEIERLGATAQRILNNVNHELRLPVGNVMNFAEMLNDSVGKLQDDQLKMMSDEVYKNSTRLSSMILNMLDLAMLSAKKIELNKKTMNFSELVEERVKNCRKIYLQNKPINFKLTIEPEILVKVDANYIRQVVDNIVINSINFSDQGLIDVTVIRQNNFVSLTIIDQGKGIPAKELADIFDPFKMGSNMITNAQGRGVGLALCKAAIEAHDGIISADSKGGVGAIFKVLIPFS